MYELEKRQRFWNEFESRGPRKGHDLYDSLPYPFENAGISHIFKDKDVLEIGPGNGRQYERIQKEVKTYSICDICPNVLTLPVFNTTDIKHLIRNWDEKIGRTFDVIHFWYVIHHICQSELQAFFFFIHQHLNNDGLVAFNTPCKINVQGDDEGDGIGTTWTDLDVLINSMNGRFDLVSKYEFGDKSTGFVFLFRKV